MRVYCAVMLFRKVRKQELFECSKRKANKNCTSVDERWMFVDEMRCEPPKMFLESEGKKRV